MQIIKQFEIFLGSFFITFKAVWPIEPVDPSIAIFFFFHGNNLKIYKIYPVITTNIKLSILSKIPPWPGKNLPVSLIFSNLFKYEIVKSPICAAVERIIAKTKYLIFIKKLKSKFENNFAIKAITKTDRREKI